MATDKQTDKERSQAREINSRKKEIHELKQELKDKVKEITTLNDNVDGLKDKNSRLSSGFHVLKKRNTDLTSSVIAVQEIRMEDKKGFNAEVSKMVSSKTKRVAWRMYKFINNPKQEQDMCMKILDDSKLREYMRTTNDELNVVIDQKRLMFCDVYSAHGREALNEQRSYVQTRGKTSAFDLLKNRNNGLYPVAAIIKVATRDIPSAEDDSDENARLMAIFVWYWEDYLPGFAGNIFWSAAIRRAQTMSMATFKSKRCIPCSTEAIAALMYENCAKKWVAMYNWTDGPTTKNL
jgi:hypothetical protein